VDLSSAGVSWNTHSSVLDSVLMVHYSDPCLFV
jgi:hypothetical protein